MHSYTEHLRDRTRRCAVKHQINQGLYCLEREEEGHSFKKPRTLLWGDIVFCFVFFFKSLWGEMQINVQGELLEAIISAVANGSRPIEVFPQRKPSTCLPQFLSAFFYPASLTHFHVLFFTISPFLSPFSFHSNSQFYLCAYLFFWTKVFPYCLMVILSFPLMVIPHLTAGRWNMEASPILLICWQKSFFFLW